MKRVSHWMCWIGILASLWFVSGCEEILQPAEILNAENNILNPSVEEGTDVPSNWYYSEADSLITQQGLWAMNTGFESSRSLKISLSSESIEYVYWAQTRVARPRNGKTMILKAQVRADNIVGQGATLILRGDNSEEPKGEGESLATSQGSAKIVGSHDWTEYEVIIEGGMDKNTQSVSIYLAFLPETTGTVYFDEISLGYID